MPSRGALEIERRAVFLPRLIPFPVLPVPAQELSLHRLLKHSTWSAGGTVSPRKKADKKEKSKEAKQKKDEDKKKKKKEKDLKKEEEKKEKKIKKEKLKKTGAATTTSISFIPEREASQEVQIKRGAYRLPGVAGSMLRPSIDVVLQQRHRPDCGESTRRSRTWLARTWQRNISTSGNSRTP